MKVDSEKLRLLIQLMDLTRLTENDSESAIQTLCESAQTPLGPVTAVCIYPQFVLLAKKILKSTAIKIATVANFPAGNETLVDCIAEIKTALANGADEIDVVLPYESFLAGERESVKAYIQACKAICDKKLLKVILETGALIKNELIAEATALSIESGANFIKTSTGKIPINATLSAAETILSIIKKYPKQNVGLKLSGGIQTVEQATEYLTLVKKQMGSHWITPYHLRFGASRLLTDILKHDK